MPRSFQQTFLRSYMTSTGLETFKKQLKQYSKELTPEELIKWKPTYWANLIAVAAGLCPFQEPATKTIPPALRVFLPRDNFKPTSEDRKYAVGTLNNALDYINSAIVETTKQAYMNFTSLGGAQLPVDFESVVTELIDDLNVYEKRKMYFQAGMSMMPAEEAWVGKHHIFAVGVINWYDANPDKVLTAEEYLNIARDLGILLEDDTVSFDPLAANKEPEQDASNVFSDLVNSIGSMLQQDNNKD